MNGKRCTDADFSPCSRAQAGPAVSPAGDDRDRLRFAPLARAYAGQRVLVVGADGFLGMNCLRALRACGAEVAILTRRAVPRFADGGVRILHADLREAQALADIVKGHSIVLDFAGVSGAVTSNQDPVFNLDAECRPHLNLFLACAHSDSRPVLMFCSSRLVYGKPDYVPVGEAHPLRPESFYAVHKTTLEYYLQVLEKSLGLRSCIIRLSNPYGPFPPEESKSYGLINQFIQRALNGEPITVFGDGLQCRDYIHVDDVMEAFLRCAVNERCWGEIFNLGNATPISIREAVEVIVHEIAPTPVRFVPWPREHLTIETGDYITDIRKIKRFVELSPQLSFQEGLVRSRPDFLRMAGAGTRAGAATAPSRVLARCNAVVQSSAELAAGG
jgi:UDP-glucose 4-epimerase